MHPLPRRGMGEAQLAGEQRKRTLVARLTVFAFAHQRQTAGRKLYTYLVRSPSVQRYVNLTQSLRVPFPLIVKHGLLHALCRGVGDEGHLPRLVAVEQVGERRALLGLAVDDCHIVLFKLALAHLTAQLRRRSSIARKHHQSAHRAVEPVNRAHIRLFVPKLAAQQLRESARLVRRQYASRLYTHYYALVPVNYIHKSSARRYAKLR